ncbi:MAG: TIGR04219 family outer membrane beta-barrel protein [Gammaproteobacteria bacterium]
MKRFIALITCLAFTAPALADTVGAYIGTGWWQHKPTGLLRYQGGDMDLQDNLGLSTETENFSWITIEHPIPLLPNFRFQHNKLSLSGVNTTTVTFGGNTFSGNVASDGSLDQTDATFYYQVLDNWVNLDLGVNIKHIDGSFALADSGSRQSKSFATTVPMFYGSAVFDLPFTGLSAGVEGSHVQYNNSQISDYRAKLSYEWSGGLGLEGGWRHQQFKLDDVDNVYSDIKVKGPFLDLYYHF